MSAIGFIWDYWLYVLIGVVAIVALGVCSYLFKNWKLAAGAGAVGLALLTLGKAFSEGQKKAKERQELLTQKAIKQVQETHAEVARMSDDDVTKELEGWVKK